MKTAIQALEQYFEQWNYPSDYCGDDFEGYWVIYTVTRDSDHLDKSNYETIQSYLDDYGIEYITPSFGHWACGWLEQILVHEKIANKHHEILCDIGRKLEDYPILDEEDLSDREFEEVQEYWQDMSIKERVYTIKRVIEEYPWSARYTNIFQARHDICSGYIYDYLRDLIC